MTTSKATGTKAAIYLRTSTNRQHTENQRPEVDRLVLTRGFEISEVYEENVSSVAKVRPEFNRMMADAHKGAFEVLVVWSLDRLGRSMLGNLQTVLDLGRTGVRVLSVRESFLDSDLGPARQLLLGVLGWVAEQERLRIGDRVRAELDRARRHGVKLGRPPAHVNVGVAVEQQHLTGVDVRGIAETIGRIAAALGGRQGRRRLRQVPHSQVRWVFVPADGVCILLTSGRPTEGRTQPCFSP
jgi:DNA invertase Pin-like site-specific DNA recombinase